MEFRSYTSSIWRETLADITVHVIPYLMENGVEQSIATALAKLLEGFTAFWTDIRLRHFDGTRAYVIELWDGYRMMNVYDCTDDVRLWPDREYVCLIFRHSGMGNCIRSIYMGGGKSIIEHLGMSLEVIHLRYKLKEVTFDELSLQLGQEKESSPHDERFDLILGPEEST